MVRNRLHVRILLALVCINVLLLCFFIRTAAWEVTSDYQQKRKAIDIAMRGQEIIGSQLVGEEYTPITTTLGSPEAKRLSLHPDFAAVTVELLKEANVGSGDYVAVNMSGSFPALNISVLAAIKAVGANPVIVSSVGASTWGANRPEYTWLDMEKTLTDGGLWPWRSSAAAIGGVGDYGGGLAPEGLEMAQRAIERSGVPELESANVEQGIEQRVRVFRKLNGSLPAALINVGGSHVIFGERGHKAYLGQGMMLGYRASLAASDGLAAGFINENRPVIHLLNIARLAAQYHIGSDTVPGTSKALYARSLSGGARIAIVAWLIFMVMLLWYGKQRQWWQGPNY